jgi:branched-chain amino acid transport system substrate-binding protein
MVNVKSARVVVFLSVILALLLICGNVYAQKSQKPPIKLGVLCAWDYAGGQGVKRGAEMAIRDINKAGGLLGRELVGVHYDNRLSADEAKKATERLLYSDKVDAITGFWRSDLAIAVQPLIMEAKKIMMVAGAAAPVLTTQRIRENYELYKNTFAVCSSSTHNYETNQMGIIKGLPLGLNKIAVLVEKAAWADPHYDAVMNKYKQYIVYSSRFSPNTTDFQVDFAKANAAGANLLWLISTGVAGTPAVKQWHDMQLPMLLTGYNVEGQTREFYKITEGKCEGNENHLAGGTAGFAVTPKSIPWFNDYIKTYGEKPSAYTSGYAYDGVMIWAEAVKIAGTTDTDAVRKVLESKNFKYTGVCGQVDGYDEEHNLIGAPWGKGGPWGFINVQWQNGEQKVIWPEGFKTLKTYPLNIPKRTKDLMMKHKRLG